METDVPCVPTSISPFLSAFVWQKKQPNLASLFHFFFFVCLRLTVPQPRVLFSRPLSQTVDEGDGDGDGDGARSTSAIRRPGFFDQVKQTNKQKLGRCTWLGTELNKRRRSAVSSPLQVGRCHQERRREEEAQPVRGQEDGESE